MGLALVSAGTLFVAPQSSSIRARSPALNHYQHQIGGGTRIAAGAAAFSSQTATIPSVTRCLGCLALLCASAGLRGRSRQQSKKIQVACLRTPTACAHLLLPGAAAREVEAGAVHDDLQTATLLPPLAGQEALPEVVAAQAHGVSGFQQQELLGGLQFPAGLEVPVAAPSCPASAPSWRASAARFIGGARRSRSHGRSKIGGVTGCRASRRSTGAKLQQTVQHEVLPLSFDPSCLRMKIQLGLRVPSCLCSERGRESKTPSTSKGSDMSTGVRIQANEFGQRRSQRQITTMNNCGSACPGGSHLERQREMHTGLYGLLGSWRGGSCGNHRA